MSPVFTRPSRWQLSRRNRRRALYGALVACMALTLWFNAWLVERRTEQLKAEFGISSPDLYVELSMKLDEMTPSEAYESLKRFGFIHLEQRRGARDRVYLVALGCDELIDFTLDAMYLHCSENGEDLSVLSGIYR